ncbi:UNVERIFIED_CONTAM: hypothetical protein FKN15_007313 [Acipenser sinensis]
MLEKRLLLYCIIIAAGARAMVLPNAVNIVHFECHEIEESGQFVWKVTPLDVHCDEQWLFQNVVDDRIFLRSDSIPDMRNNAAVWILSGVVFILFPILHFSAAMFVVWKHRKNGFDRNEMSKLEQATPRAAVWILSGVVFILFPILHFSAAMFVVWKHRKNGFDRNEMSKLEQATPRGILEL